MDSLALRDLSMKSLMANMSSLMMNNFMDSPASLTSSSTSFSTSTPLISDMNGSSSSSSNSSTRYTPYSERPETYLVPIVFLFIFISGVIGNGTLIYVMIKEKLLRSSSHLYILNLSLGDLIVIIGVVPFVGTIYTFESWPFGIVVCKLSEFIRDVSIGVSVMTLSAMSIDRYRAAFATTLIRVTARSGGRSGPYSLVSSMKTQTGGVMLGIWFVAATLAAPTAYFSFILKIPHPNHPGDKDKRIDICYPFPEELGSYYPKIVVLAKCVVFYIIPLLIIGCCYVSIAVHLISKSSTSVASGVASGVASASSTSSRVAIGSSVSALNTSSLIPLSTTTTMTTSTTSPSQVYYNNNGVRSSPIDHPIPPPPSNSPSIQRFSVNNSYRSLPYESSQFVKKSATRGNDLLFNSPVDVRMTEIVDKSSSRVTTRASPEVNSPINSSPKVVLTSPGGSPDSTTKLDVAMTGDQCRNHLTASRQPLQSTVTVVEKYSPISSSGLRRSRKKSQSRAKMILLLVIIFLVCFFPNHLFMMWFYYHPYSQDLYNQFWHVWKIAAFCLTFLNSTLNPITLYLTSDQFKSLFNKYIWTKACDNNDNNLSPSDSSSATDTDHHDHCRGSGGKRSQTSSSQGKSSDRQSIGLKKKKKLKYKSSLKSPRFDKTRESFSLCSSANDNKVLVDSYPLNDPSTDHRRKQLEERQQQEANMTNHKKGNHDMDCVGGQRNSVIANSHNQTEDCIKFTHSMQRESEGVLTDIIEGRTHQRKSTPHKSYFRHRNHSHNHNNNHHMKNPFSQDNQSDNNSKLNEHLNQSLYSSV